MSQSTSLLTTMLDVQRLSQVVDIGANPIDGEPPYLPMLRGGLCHVTGFEPQPEALAELKRRQGANEIYLPYAVGDGQSHTLNVCRASGMTSLYRPDSRVLSGFNDFEMLGEVTGTTQIETVRLDDIDEVTAMDFLKIDIQGAELAVFEGGREKLQGCAVIQTEVSFIALYENQPVFWQIDRELRSQGFVPHAFAAVKRWPLAPWVQNQDPRQPLNQLLEADLIYVRNILSGATPDADQLKHLAIIAHHCFGSHDLVLRCLKILTEQHGLTDSACDQYLDWVGNGRPRPQPKPNAEVISFDIDFKLN